MLHEIRPRPLCSSLRSFQPLSFDIVAKTPGAAPLSPANPTSSLVPLADRCSLISDHSFQVKSFASHSYEKTPGVQGFVLTNPCRKSGLGRLSFFPFWNS